MFQNNIFLLILLFSCAQLPVAKKMPSDKETKSLEENVSIKLDVYKEILPNGLKVLVIENHNLPIFSYYTFFDVGARYERPGQTGATHFLEHLMFKGAKKYGPGKFDTLIESNGGNTNAFTTFDSTVYYENLPVKNLELIVDMEADRMTNLLLEEKTFEHEKNVVLEERKLRYENSPSGKLYHSMMKEMFKGTPYGGSVIGEKEDVSSLKREEVQNYFKKYYAPNNGIVVIAGDVETKKVMALIKEYYGPLKASPELNALKGPLDDKSLYRFKKKMKSREVSIHGNSPSPQFIISFKGRPLGEEEAFVLDMLASILGEGESSYLNQLYVYGKKPLLSSIYVSNYTLKHNGVFFISGSLLNRVNLKKFKRRFAKDSRKFCRKAITERALQKTKNQYLVSYVHALQSNAGLAKFIGFRENFFNDYSFYKKEIEIYDTMNVEQVKKACVKLFKNNNSIFLSVWNKHKKRKV